MLKKDERIIDVWKRIPKFALDLVLFSLLYCWTDAFFYDYPFSLEETLYGIIKSEYTHLWYLYAYIAFLISLPFFRKMIRGLDKVTAIYMLVVAFFASGITSCFDYSIISVNSNIIIAWITVNIFIYPAAGYIIDTLIDDKAVSKWTLILLWTVIALCQIWAMSIEYDIQMNIPGDADEKYLTCFSLITATGIFLTVRKLCKIEGRWRNIIIDAGRCVYGIYLIHFWVLCRIPFFSSLWRGIIDRCPLGGEIGAMFCSVCVFLICGIIVYVLRRIPLIRALF